MSPTTAAPSPSRDTVYFKVAAILVSGALVMSWVVTFLHHHHFMSKALELHFSRPGHYIFGVTSPAQWEVVWELSQSADSKEEFLNNLRDRGLMKLDSGTALTDRTAIGTAKSSAEKSHTADSADHLDLERSAVQAAAAAAATVSKSSSSSGTRTSGGNQRLAGRPPGVQPQVGQGLAYSKSGPLLLSPDMARQQSVDGVTIVTWANNALWDFTWSWVVNVRKLGLENFLVGAMDAQIGARMVARSVPCFAMYELKQNHSGVGEDHLAWGGESFHKMGRQKITLAKLFLGIQLSFLLIDVDVVLLQNPLPYFAAHPQADILVTSDHLVSTTEAGDVGLEWPARAGAPMNIGFMYFKFNHNTTVFVDRWLDAILADDKLWDQLAFNELARAGWDPLLKVHSDDKRVFVGFNGSLNVGILPVAMFSGGHTFFIQKLHEVMKVQPYAVHCTFQMGGNRGKRDRMREAMLFIDEPEYYLGDKYVSMDLKHVPNMAPKDYLANLNATEMKAYQHNGLIMQMEPVFPAMAIASLFDRATILPKVACYCDRYWMDLDQCRVPGATTMRIPFLCPGDHVTDPNFFSDEYSKLIVRYREHSFLENPRCPDEVKRSRLTVYTCKDCKEPREKFVVQEGGRVLLVPQGQSEAQLRTILAPYQDIRVWHFRDPLSLWSGQWSDAAQGLEFKKRADHLRPDYRG